MYGRIGYFPPIKVGFINSVISLLAVALGAGAAGALNMWYESDLDAIMSRTCLRPIPSGKIKKFEALYFGIILTIISISLLYYVSNLTASLLAFTIFFYFFVYTVWLKKKTSQNIVIGGAAGALPPMIGWAISSNSITLTSFFFVFNYFYMDTVSFFGLLAYTNLMTIKKPVSQCCQ